MVHEVYEGGAAAMDGRLRKGDQILEVNSVDYGNIPFETAFNTLRQCLRKVRKEFRIYNFINVCQV